MTNRRGTNRKSAQEQTDANKFIRGIREPSKIYGPCRQYRHQSEMSKKFHEIKIDDIIKITERDYAWYVKVVGRTRCTISTTACDEWGYLCSDGVSKMTAKAWSEMRFFKSAQIVEPLSGRRPRLSLSPEHSDPEPLRL